MLETLTAFFTCFGKALGLISQRDAEKNAPDVKAAAVAGSEQSEVDAATQATATKNVSATRDELSEN